MEGPFLSAAKKGAQNGAFLHDPDISMLKRLQEAAEGCVKLVTLAPEQPGAMEFIREAVSMGIAVSLGHTTADYDTAKTAFEAGANHTTHTYNAMPPFVHRNPGVIGAAFDSGAFAIFTPVWFGLPSGSSEKSGCCWFPIPCVQRGCRMVIILWAARLSS